MKTITQNCTYTISLSYPTGPDQAFGHSWPSRYCSQLSTLAFSLNLKLSSFRQNMKMTSVCHRIKTSTQNIARLYTIVCKNILSKNTLRKCHYKNSVKNLTFREIAKSSHWTEQDDDCTVRRWLITECEWQSPRKWSKRSTWNKHICQISHCE